jgi:hypothetical protein
VELKPVPSLIPCTFHKEYTQKPSAELLVHGFSKLTAAVSQYMLLASLVIFRISESMEALRLLRKPFETQAEH